MTHHPTVTRFSAKCLSARRASKQIFEEWNKQFVRSVLRKECNLFSRVDELLALLDSANRFGFIFSVATKTSENFLDFFFLQTFSPVENQKHPLRRNEIKILSTWYLPLNQLLLHCRNALFPVHTIPRYASIVHRRYDNSCVFHSFPSFIHSTRICRIRLGKFHRS